MLPSNENIISMGLRGRAHDSATIDASLLVHNHNLVDSEYHRAKSLQQQQHKQQLKKTKINSDYSMQQQHRNRRVKEREKLLENMNAAEECNKIKYESYLEHFQRQRLEIQQHEEQQQGQFGGEKVDDSYTYQQYNNRTPLLLHKYENFYDDTFVENGLTTENINADKRELTEKLCYMLSGESEPRDQGNSSSVVTSHSRERDQNEWVVSDTLCTYDVDKGSFVLSNGTKVQTHPQQQQQNKITETYKRQQQQQQKQQRFSKMKRKTSAKSSVSEEVALTPFLSVGIKRTTDCRSRSSSSGSRLFDDVDDVDDDDDDDDDVDDNDDDDDDNDYDDDNIVDVVATGSRYDSDLAADSDDDNNTRRLFGRDVAFSNILYAGNGCDVAATAGGHRTVITATTTTTTTTATKIITNTTTNTNKAKTNEQVYRDKLTSLTNSRWVNLTEQYRYNDFYKRNISNAITGSSLNSSTLSTTSSSSTSASTTSQQPQQIKYYLPTYSIQQQQQLKHKQSKQNKYQQQINTTGDYLNFTKSTSAATMPSSNKSGSKIFSAQFHSQPTETYRHTTTTSSTATPPFIGALNYYGTGAAVDSLYAHTYVTPRHTLTAASTTTTTTITKSTNSLNKLASQEFSDSAQSTQQRYQLGATTTTMQQRQSNQQPSGSYILEYEC